MSPPHGPRDNLEKKKIFCLLRDGTSEAQERKDTDLISDDVKWAHLAKATTFPPNPMGPLEDEIIWDDKNYESSDELLTAP